MCLLEAAPHTVWRPEASRAVLGLVSTQSGGLGQAGCVSSRSGVQGVSRFFNRHARVSDFIKNTWACTALVSTVLLVIYARSILSLCRS